MNTLTIVIGNDTVFDKIEVGANISKLVFEWGKEVKQWDESHVLYKLRNYLFNILQKNKDIKVLDLSRVTGLKESYYPTKYLHEIYYPDSIESVTFIKERTLKKVSAPGAKSITIKQAPNLETIEYGTNLENLSLTETGLSHIELPENIKLGACAFKGCEKLKSVILNSGTDVPPSTFEGCTNLTEITLPDDLLVIEPNLFCGCSSLRCIYGGKSVKQVFPSAFTGCHSLRLMECKDFYRYSDLKFSEKQWMDTFRPYKPLGNIKALIRKFVQELKKKDIECPEEYVADNFFRETENHYGFVMEYQSRIRGWMIWSLSHNCFLATRGDRLGLRQDEVVTFTLERKPVITFEDNMCLQFPMIYIDESSSLKKIERKEEDYEGYNYILEYFTPKVSLVDCYRKILQKIEALDIPSIIDSYSIKERTWWHTYPGRDDSQFYERIAKSDYSDIYLDTFLPQENTQNYDNGCRPWDFDEDEETRKLQASADSEAKSRKEYAHKHYSKDEHICRLLEDYINKRIELEKDMESVHHIQAVKNFLHCRYVDYGEDENSLIEFYGYTIEDILNDNKYNERISWSYKHGWVEETE